MLHAGSFAAGILAAGKNCMPLRFTKSWGQKLVYGHNSNTEIHIPSLWIPACRFGQVLSSDIQFVENRHCSQDLHSCSLFSIPFCEIAMSSKSLSLRQLETQLSFLGMMVK